MIVQLLTHPIYAPLFAAILGAILGSFMGALVSRWPAGRSVLAPRSACDSCGTPLRWYELVPIVSFLIQRGKCRYCGAAIGSDALAIEVIAAVIGAVSLIIMPGWGGVMLAFFGWLLLPLAWLDMRHYWLPDPLVIVLALGGLGLGMTGLFPPPLLDRIIGGIGGFVALAAVSIAYRALRGRDGLGGGDPKLFGAIGLWLGWQMLPFLLLAAAGFGLILALVAIIGGRQIGAATQFPFGTLLAIPAWLLLALGGPALIG
ncbi:prepilin peptidase [Alterisphingorhabdus coralli]|uniref:Prepilin leader peptidase/N-methyltransferase n=1 Tax=Alterisphingorhabdus coralli TaxID=3071408 RepID=A0AA97FAY7_9SPHN|nr:prepilin peptidase [Parasphingorhabdus sp. SCSIO 66989]WOE76287.1 prepilin peptidase [Parasphingorhabdus sp. SCSIO 66989]